MISGRKLILAQRLILYSVSEGGKINGQAWSAHGFNRSMQNNRHEKRMREQRVDKKKAWDARSEIERKRKLPPRKCSFTDKLFVLPWKCTPNNSDEY